MSVHTEAAPRWRFAETRRPYWLAGAALTVAVATHLYDFGHLNLSVRLLDSSDEWSYTHLLSTAAMAVGTVAGVAGARRSRSRAWWATGGLFGVLFLDNLTRVHVHIPVWPAIYAPLLGGLAAALLAVSRGTREAPVVRAGLGVLAASLGIHVFGHAAVSAMDWGPETWGYQIKVAFKEATELAGWLLIAPALARLALMTRARAARG